MELGVWAGVVPFERLVRAPLPDAQLPSGVALPEYLARYAEGKPSR